MLRCQFLRYVLKTLFFIEIALKLSYFCKKCKTFERWGLRPQTPVLPAAGGLAPHPSASGSCSLRPQPLLDFGGWRLRPQTQKLAPLIANFWLRAWFHFWWKPFYWSSPEFGEKWCSIFEDLFFALHLISSSEKNGGRGSSPRMLKIGQNWGKIANYPPNAQQRFSPQFIRKWFQNQLKLKVRRPSLEQGWQYGSPQFLLRSTIRWYGTLFL